MPGMARSRSSVDGFTLLEALVALAILGVVVVVGVEGVGLGASARARAAEYADLRTLSERKLAEVATLSGTELQEIAGRHEGRFAPPFEDAVWQVSVTETEPGNGLYLIVLGVSKEEASLTVSTYANRYGELWAQRRSETERG
jgi:prepilin-type N-terminal cleavage/methylation domain-containing protein